MDDEELNRDDEELIIIERNIDWYVNKLLYQLKHNGSTNNQSITFRQANKNAISAGDIEHY
ncbi:hypothetical protein BLOT_015440 [Blomia tropicalis]|nr:hypothetical protein BLOT_015440 [Blomia tropicalis]